MLKLFNDVGEISGQGNYDNPVNFNLDARFNDEVVQMLTLSCAENYTAHNVTLTDSGDTADRYFFSVNGTSWADSVTFDTITDKQDFYIKARTSTAETAATLRDTKLILNYELQPAATPNFYYTNPGDADLLAVEGATTVNVNSSQSITGKAFYGGVQSDMFNTPAGLKEIWMRFDFYFGNLPVNASYFDLKVGHYSTSLGATVGIFTRNKLGYNHGTIEMTGGELFYSGRYNFHRALLHIKSGTDGQVDFTLNKDARSYSGNVNGGGDLNTLFMQTHDDTTLFSNVVISDAPIDINTGFHRDLFTVETCITAPILNVRYLGEVHQFLLTTKKTTPALAVRVGDRNFYAPLVKATDSTASAVRLYLNDTNYAIKT